MRAMMCEHGIKPRYLCKKCKHTKAQDQFTVVRAMEQHFIHERERLKSQYRGYLILPISIEGKITSINNMLDNLQKIKEHVSALNANAIVKRRTRDAMVKQLLEKEGLLVSRRLPLERDKTATQRTAQSI